MKLPPPALRTGRWKKALRCALLAALGIATARFAAAESPASNDTQAAPIESALTAASATLTPRARQTLTQIDGVPRRLLALRSYLRAKSSLKSRWSWSEAEIEAYESSAQHAQMLADIRAVTARFERENPGYTLYVNTQVRSVGVQLERWNENRTVGRVADALHAALLEHLAQSPAEPSTQGFAQFLIDWRPPVPIPLAAPGLSLHGQSKALDFQVRAGDRLVASTDTSTVAHVWKGQGWARKVAAAIAESSNKFAGPLAAPNEPWHFEYVAEPIK